jgi:hypothetical protein
VRLNFHFNIAKIVKAIGLPQTSLARARRKAAYTKPLGNKLLRTMKIG